MAILDQTKWYWNRLRCMSADELAYRLQQTAYSQVQRLGLLTASASPQPQFNISASPIIVGTQQGNNEHLLLTANKVLSGQLSIFTLKSYPKTPGIHWNRDPLTGTNAPLTFGKTLNYRDKAQVGDIKYLWEPNRHLHLVNIAQAYFVTGKSVYLQGIESHMNSWLEQCPYLRGANWASSLELGIRLINWSITWALIGGLDSPLFSSERGQCLKKRWLSSIYQHADFIFHHFSRFSSANNHLIGEAAGLFIAATQWPHWSSCNRWQNTAQAILERETLKQNADDGVNKEQAIAYQQFVLDFLILAGVTGNYNNRPFSSAYWKRIEKMLEFIASVMDVAGNIPMIGDADDGYVVRLAHNPGWAPYRSLLATGAILFRRGDFKVKAGDIDDKTLWLLGDKSKEQYEQIVSNKQSLPVRRHYPQGGYYIIGSDFESTREVRLIIDAGPLGYERIAAHGHADALSFTLSIAGLEFLIDPGTYAYHVNKRWREYFRGTSAHNTIRMDYQDQSDSGGNFMWRRKANCSCEHWLSNSHRDQFVGVHDGYTRLPDPVIHRRNITYHKMRRTILVEDHIQCEGQHTLEGFWHFAEACQVAVKDNVIIAGNHDHSIELKLLKGHASYEIFHGDTSRPLGWVSRGYNVKRPCSTATWKADISGECTFVTQIQCPDNL